MSEHFRAFSAVFPMIFDGGGHVLLHRRKNTGYQDGKWDLAGSGHVDEGETATEAVIRECKEEVGITVASGDIAFAHLSHRLSSDRTYYDMYFAIHQFAGVPAIMEPDKCMDLQWFAIDRLPEDMIACRLQAIKAHLSNRFYSEIVDT